MNISKPAWEPLLYCLSNICIPKDLFLRTTQEGFSGGCAGITKSIPLSSKSEAFTRNKVTNLIPTSLDTYYSPGYKKMDTFYPFISYKNQPASWLVEMLFTISTTYGVGNFWFTSC